MRCAMGLLVVLACSSGLAHQSSARVLTFEERLKAQTAIERVYWRHRIWPTENAEPKPSFEASMSESFIRDKVDNYLQASDGLEVLWQSPITAADLQTEMNRMVSETRDPELLDELFAALGYDPVVIAECLARPILADLRIRNRYARDDRFHRAIRLRAEAALGGIEDSDSMRHVGTNYTEVTWTLSPVGVDRPRAVADGYEVRLTEAEWNAKIRDLTARLETDRMTTSSGDERGFPTVAQCENAIEGSESLVAKGISTIQENDETFFATAVLESGPEHLKTATVLWPKESFDTWWAKERNLFDTPRRSLDASYSLELPAVNACVADRWSPVPSTTTEARWLHTAVWTGAEMVVWGGFDVSTLSSGGRYQPATGSWTPTSPGVNAPSQRCSHTAVWTGTEVIVWGGNSDCFAPSSNVNTGGRYNPATDSWTSTSTGAGVPTKRSTHLAVWTGTDMIVWGGQQSGSAVNTGGRYRPSTDSWTPTSTAQACRRGGGTAARCGPGPR